MKRAIGFVVGAAAGVPVVGYALWKKSSGDLTRRLVAQSQIQSGPDVIDLDHEALPPPVARFFRRTLPRGQRRIRVARLAQTGEFFLNGWKPFRAAQIFTASPPGFLWDARITAAPFMPVYVRDCYIGGRGAMRASVLGVFPLVNQAGAPELSAGALMRYLGEAAWFPTRLLPGDGLTWTAVDDSSARATLADGDTTVSLQFRFTNDGDIGEICSPGRFREVNGGYVPTPWRVRALGYGDFGGMRLMSSAVAEWVLPEGPLEYWRARITRVEQQY